MADVTLSDKAPRMVLSWGAFLTVLGLVAAAVRTQSEVGDHTRRIQALETQAANAATKDDIKRVEDRIIRIENLLLQQQSRTGR